MQTIGRESLKSTAKVLWISPSLGQGGAEKVVIDILSQLTDSDPRVDLLVLKKDIAHQLPVGLQFKWLLENNQRFSRNPFLALARLIHLFRDYNVIVVGQEGYWPLILLPLFRGKKTITLVHSRLSLFIENKARLLKRLMPLVRLAYRRYDAVVVVSRGIKKDLIENFGVDPKKIVCIPNGIPLGAMPTAPKIAASEPAPAEIRLLSVGRLSPEKNFPFLLKVFAALTRRAPGRKLHLTVCGDGPDREALRKLAFDLRIDDRVIFAGFIGDLNKIYAESMIYVHAGLWEGFGMSILEAMRSGLPIVSSECDGSLDILEGSPLMIPGYDAEDYCDALTRLIEDRGFYSQMVSFSLERMLRFDIKATSARYVKLFIDVRR